MQPMLPVAPAMPLAQLTPPLTPASQSPAAGGGGDNPEVVLAGAAAALTKLNQAPREGQHRARAGPTTGSHGGWGAPSRRPQSEGVAPVASSPCDSPSCLMGRLALALM